MAPRLSKGPSGINEPGGTQLREEEVRAVLDSVRAGLLADGGNVELAGISPDGTVRLQFQGSCERCPSARMTLERVVEPALREKCAGVKRAILD